MTGPWLDTPNDVAWAVVAVMPALVGNGYIRAVFTDSAAADTYARAVHGVIVALPVVADYRTDTTAREAS